MQVKAITPRGYCKGVVRAIEMAKKAKDEKKSIVILGMIVHNQYIVDALKEMGIETIDHPGKTRLELLDEIDEGTVIITAHGASDQVFEKARGKGLHVIDASCLDVIKTHNVIKTRLQEGFEVLYFGKAGHPEAEGAVSIDAERVHLITSKSDLDGIDPVLRHHKPDYHVPVRCAGAMRICGKAAALRTRREGDMYSHQDPAGGHQKYGRGCGYRVYRGGSPLQ